MKRQQKNKKAIIKSGKQKLLVWIATILVALKFILLLVFFVYLIVWIKKRI